MLGATCTTIWLAYVNHKLITSQQAEMLFSLRRALITEDVRQKLDGMRAIEKRKFPFFSRETLNLSVVSISDRFIFNHNPSVDPKNNWT